MTEATMQASWSPLGLGLRDTQGNISFETTSNATDASDVLPAVPLLASDLSSDVNIVYLPMEDLLCRHIHFPLKHPRHLDAPMLGQELADTVGIEPDDWWFTWHAEKADNGISGTVFAISKTMKHAIQNDPVWQHANFLLIDGWARLNHWLNAENTSEPITIIDVDSDGVFFGFYHHGWQGMRRLNGNMHDSEVSKHIAQQALWSLQSMGMLVETSQFHGLLTAEFKLLFTQESTTQQSMQEEPPLQPRHITNLMLPEPNKNDTNLLNFRHGKWAVRHHSSFSSTWYRPSLLAAGVCFLWLGLTSINNYQLETQLNTMKEKITTAFHRGLPQQTVIIDALAQLRQAAGESTTTGGNNSYHVTQQLNTISKVFEQTPWQMQALNIDQKGTSISGKVNKLDTLNSIRDSLEKEAGTTVQIADTELNGDEVAFRVRWQ